MRDGAIDLPKGYTPNTYDDRVKSCEAEDLYEMFKEVGYYRIEPLVDHMAPLLEKLIFRTMDVPKEYKDEKRVAGNLLINHFKLE